MSLRIHVTDRRTFKKCRRAYRYAIVERLATPETKVDALWIGSAGHQGLANYYELNRDGTFFTVESGTQAALAGWREYCSNSEEKPNAEQEHLSCELLSRYVAKYFATDQFKVKHVEVPIELQFGDVTLVLTLDLLVEWKGHLWIVDHKFLAKIPSHRQLEMDDQMTAYIWGARKAGYNVRGAIYNIIRKKLPVEPDLLQSGKLSTRSNMDTDYVTYMEAITRRGLSPDDYKEFLAKLQDQEDDYFHREIVIRNKTELNLFELNLMAEFRDMASPDLVYYPNPGDQCTMCKFQQLCKSENEGADTKLLRQTYYRLKEDHER